jgi:mannan endo-1,4-beta-mannosidase
MKAGVKSFLKMAVAALAVMVLCGGLAGFYLYDYYPLNVDYSDVPAELNNKTASAEAVALYGLLKDNYGKKIFAGQYVNVFENPEKYASDVFAIAEMSAVYGVTGAYPAVLGLDASRFEDGEAAHVLQLAQDWHNAGGIVTMCWHWFAPEGESGRGSFYTKQTDFDLKAALADKDSVAYRRLLQDIRSTATMLKILKTQGVPILWRPLHEAAGGWFWWGAAGKQAYFELYRLIYDIFNDEFSLDNLIWIWNGQSRGWYVGDNYCDIIGEDTYPKKMFYSINGSMSNKFDRAYNTTPNKKMVAMSENGYLPDVDEMFDKNKVWLFCATWCYEFVCEKNENGEFVGEYSEKYTPASYLKAFYDHPGTLKLTDLNAG